MMHPFLRKILRFNWVLLALMLLLMTYGVYAIYSATWMREDHFYKSQLMWAGICLPMFFIISLIDYRWVRWGAIPFYVMMFLGLVATMVLGEKRFGARCWINLGFMSFQASQLAVVAGILVLALFLHRTRQAPAILRILGCATIVGVPWILILIEPDLGMCIVWVPLTFAMMLVGGIPKRWLIAMVILGVAMLPVVTVFGLKPYQYARVTSFINPDADPLDSGWNVTQSLIAIGSGGFSGKGFKAHNTQLELGFLPKTIVHNDFIFSVMGEQHGFVGGIALLGTFALLFVTILYVANEAGDEIGRLIAIGIGSLLFAHFFLNIGMTISVNPITGLPLPLISYGGSFLMSTLLGFAILQSIWIHRNVAD